MTNKFRKILSSTIAGSLLICSAIGSTMSVSAATASKYEYSVSDATQLQKYLVSLCDLTDTQKVLYDIDKNGELTITDATNIQKIVVGLTSDIPSENPTSSTVESTTMTTTEPTQATTVSTTNPATVEPTTIEPTTEQPTTEPKPTSVPKSVKLNKNDITFGIGEKYTLVTTVENGDISQVAFTTSDRKVATVDNNGKITAVGTGTATITANTYNGLKAQCKVTVKKLANSIKLDKTSITLGVGEQYDFSSSIPNGTAAYFRSYYSDNTAIATVQKSGGLMTAKTAGTTTIRCKLSSGREATCKVTVKSAPSSVTLNYTTSTLKVGQSEAIKVTYNNNAYSFKNKWTSSNKYVATINSDGKIYAKSLGSTTISYRTYNNKTASFKLTVSGSAVKCLDISTWQGYVDFNKVKSAGYNYVILRAGFGREYSQKDNTFERNYANAKAAGIKVGVYWFSYSTSPSDAYREANACLYCLNGKRLDMPVYYDLEYQPAMSMSNSNYTQMALNFCSTIKKAGYKSGVYSSASVYGYLLNRQTLINNGVSIWNAQWSSYCSVPCDIWQYSEKGQVNGISASVDMNYIHNLNVVD
ncbi:GH25 family lysozyme [Ruminococcus bromii]|jgi:GH25 family lysozyme M1 (1,4-beta-N-acetylmuramidase)|uniref:GH25 family lysozyme n=1 Tax=Ruminococcus bromii TaxID=40518 RepID=UPI002FB0254F